MGLELLGRGSAAMGIELSADQVELFDRYADAMIRANERLNLTRITDPEQVQSRHFLDSLTCALPVLGELKRGVAWRCIDVGSGAGLPGIPLAIAFPALRVTLLEATGKKARFLEALVEELGLTGATVAAARAEEAGRDRDHRDGYELVVARALAPLPVALEWCLPFSVTGGRCILPRGSDLAEQLPTGRVAAGELGARLLAPWPITVPELPPGRALVVAQKLRQTPDRFPRRPGVASSRPLGVKRAPESPPAVESAEQFG
jgi:16S rRNA (guanine527-N7)-methyltransferase